MCGIDSPYIAQEFPPTPLGDRLQKTKEIALMEKQYPLRLCVCSRCSHLYLSDIINPDLSYLEYAFESHSSPGLEESMKVSKEFVENLIKSKIRTALDIGANDGTWLDLFRKEGTHCFAIEPSPRHCSELKAKGIDVLQGYFSKEVIDNLHVWLKGRNLDLVSINNTLANIDDPQVVFELFSIIDTGTTSFSIITGYHFDQFNAGMYDYVYHEHLSYFSITDLYRLCKKFGFDDIRVRKLPLKGGSIQIVFRKGEVEPHHQEEIERFMQMEKWFLGTAENYAKDIAIGIDNRIKRVQNALEMLEATGKSVVGYGYSHSVATLVYLSAIENRIIRFVDDNPARWNKYTPGNGLLIGSPIDIDSEKEAVLILAWQHGSLIKQKIQKISPSLIFMNSSLDGDLGNGSK